MNQLDRFRARWHSFTSYRLQPFAARYGKNLVKPASFCIKLTERCNSKCVHCDIWIHNKSEGEATTEDWIRTLDHIRSWAGPVNVVFTGGEVFLRKDTLNILRHAGSIGLVYEVLTNGLLTNRERCEQLVLAGPDQVTISLDGVTPETHFAVRRIPNMYEKILETVDNLDEFRRKHKTQMKILHKMVIMKPNLHEVVRMADWVKERGQAELMVQPIEQNYAQEENLFWFKSSDLWITDLDRVRETVRELVQRKQSGYPIRNSISNLESIVPYFEDPEPNMRRVQRHMATQACETCMTGVSAFEISANGDVRWCWNMPPVGNIKRASPREIWENRFECWKTDCGYFL